MNVSIALSYYIFLLQVEVSACFKDLQNELCNPLMKMNKHALCCIFIHGTAFAFYTHSSFVSDFFSFFRKKCKTHSRLYVSMRALC